MTRISDERLKMIAEGAMTSAEELFEAVRDCATAILDARQGVPQASQQRDGLSKPTALGNRAVTKCRHCGDDVAVFVSKKSGKAYECDIKLDWIENVRTTVTGANWFHNCIEGKAARR